MTRRVPERLTLAAMGLAVSVAFACNTERAPERSVDATPRTEPTAEARTGTPGWITTKIQSQYFVNPEIKPWNIEVTTTSGGVVTLRGQVETAQDKAEAVRIARDTEGVTRVEDMLRVQGETVATTGASDAPAAVGGSPRVDEPSDIWITTKVQAKYYGDDEIRGRTVDVDTQGGVVTLKGTVDTYAARRQAVALARNTDGVREVRDELRVEGAGEGKPPAAGGDGQTAPAGEVDDAWILTKIQSKYFLDPDVKGRDINVNAENGTVTLTGSVEAEAQKQTAEKIARETEGVQDVRNQLEVRPAPTGQP